MLGLDTVKLLNEKGFSVRGCPAPWMCVAVKGSGPPVMVAVDWVMHIVLIEKGEARIIDGSTPSGTALLRDPLSFSIVGRASLVKGRGDARINGGWRGTWLLADLGECRGEVESLVRGVAESAGIVYAVLAYSPRRPIRLPRWPPLKAPASCRPPVEAAYHGDTLQG